MNRLTCRRLTCRILIARPLILAGLQQPGGRQGYTSELDMPINNWHWLSFHASLVCHAPLKKRVATMIRQSLSISNTHIISKLVEIYNTKYMHTYNHTYFHSLHMHLLFIWSMSLIPLLMETHMDRQMDRKKWPSDSSNTQPSSTLWQGILY